MSNAFGSELTKSAFELSDIQFLQRMEQNGNGPGLGVFFQLFMAGHLVVVEGDFVGDKTAEKNVGILFLFVLK